MMATASRCRVRPARRHLAGRTRPLWVKNRISGAVVVTRSGPSVSGAQLATAHPFEDRRRRPVQVRMVRLGRKPGLMVTSQKFASGDQVHRKGTSPFSKRGMIRVRRCPRILSTTLAELYR